MILEISGRYETRVSDHILPYVFLLSLLLGQLHFGSIRYTKRGLKSPGFAHTDSLKLVGQLLSTSVYKEHE